MPEIYRILLIEDDPDDAFFASKPWLDKGHEVKHIQTLNEALAEISTHKFDFILVDPGLRDVEDRVVEAPKRIERVLSRLGLDTPIIPLSGNSDPNAAKQIRAEGFDWMLSKDALFEKSQAEFMAMVLKAAQQSRMATAGASSSREQVHALEIEIARLSTRLEDFEKLEGAISELRQSLYGSSSRSGLDTDFALQGQNIQSLRRDLESAISNYNAALHLQDSRFSEALSKLNERITSLESQISAVSNFLSSLLSILRFLKSHERLILSLVGGSGVITLILQLLKLLSNS